MNHYEPEYNNEDRKQYVRQDPNFWKLLCVLFFIFLMIGVVYLLDDAYRENNIELYQEGYINGTQDTLIVMLNKGLNCETIPLRFNETIGINLIAAECLPEEVIEYLQQGAQQNG